MNSMLIVSEEVGCDTDGDSNVQAVVADCDGLVYEVFSPAALTTNNAVISGLMLVFKKCQLWGPISSTPHQWTTGATSAFAITSI